MSDAEKPKESKEEKKERLAKEKEQKKDQKAEQKKEPDKGKEPKADKKAKAKAETKGDAKAEAKGDAKPGAKPDAAAKAKQDPKAEKKPGQADKAGVGTAKEQGGALEGESVEAGEDGAVEGAPDVQVAEPAATIEPPPPKKPLPRGLLYGLIIIVLGPSIFAYATLELYKIPDVLWFVPFVAVVMGLLQIWKHGLFDRWGQTLLVGGILSHFALLVWTDGSKVVPTITIPLMFIWAGFLVFAKGFQAWLKSRQPEEPVVVPPPPVKEHKRWTFEDMDAVLAEIGEMPAPGALDGQDGQNGPDEPAADAGPTEDKEKPK
jgi:hypothetical protein